LRCIRAAHLSSGLGGSTRVDRVKRLTRNITKYGVHTHGLRDTRPSGPRGSSGAPSPDTPPAGRAGARAGPAGSRKGRPRAIRSPSLRVLGIIALPVSGYPVWTVRADAPSARARRAGVGSCGSLASSRTRHGRHDPGDKLTPAGAAGDPQTFTESDQHRHNAVQCGALYSRLDSAAPSQALGERQCD